MAGLRIATRTYLDGLIAKRPGEAKLGEMVQCAGSDDWQQAIESSSAGFVILGIPEDIGVRANHGVGGAHTLWEPALRSILNVQHTDKLQGNNIFVLGAFDFSELLQQSEHVDVMGLREMVAHIDEIVAPVIQKIASAGKVPVIIGGGHNNAYPIIQGLSMAKGAAVNCINLDAHSDYRQMEGRHSGNGFRYARSKGYLDKYAVIGLHENYNAQEIVNDFASDAALHCSFYEDIFIREKYSYHQSLRDAVVHTTSKATGVELDLDCVAHALSSAATPSGVTALQAREYISTCAALSDVAYVHITEGAVKLRDGREDYYTAKLVAYLLTDFFKAYLSR